MMIPNIEEIRNVTGVHMGLLWTTMEYAELYITYYKGGTEKYIVRRKIGTDEVLEYRHINGAWFQYERYRVLFR